MLMRLAHGVVFYTDHEVDEYRAGTGAHDTRPIVGLNNGINTSSIQVLRAPYAAQERGPEILFIGRQTAKARLPLLIKALASPQLANARLHVVGEGIESASSYAAAETLGVINRIHWHGASTDEAVIAPIANRCRIFVYPGEVGLSLIHGMAYGLPCVVHSDRWRHMPEFAGFEEGLTGRSYVHGDTDDLAQVVCSLLNEEETLNRMSHQCIAVTTRSYNTEDMAKRLLEMVKRLK